MHPITHSIVGWTLANTVLLTHLDHALISLAGTVPDGQSCSETSSVFIIRPTAQRYGALVIIFGVVVIFDTDTLAITSPYHPFPRAQKTPGDQRPECGSRDRHDGL
jgi:hypothetical protein